MKYRHRVLAFLFLLSVITVIDRVSIAVAGDRIQDDLRFGAEKWGWIVGSFALAYAIFEIPTGVLADKIGPRRVLTRIVLWWSVFTSLTGLTWSFGWMLIVRFMFGAGEAGAYPAGTSALARWFPHRENARAQSLFWIGGRLGAALTPFLVIPILHYSGWRLLFVALGIPGLAWALSWYAWFRDMPEEKKGVRQAELNEISGRMRINPVTEGRPAPPLTWRLVLSQPAVWWLVAMYHAYCWMGYFFLSWMHIFLVRGRAYAPIDLVRFSWLPFVIGGITIFIGGITSDALVRRIGLRWGRRLVGLVGMSASAVAMLMAARTEDKVLTIVFLTVAFGASDFMMPAAWAVCLDIAGRHAGAISAMMNTAGQIGSFLTAVVFGYLVGATGSYDAPLYLMAGMGALSALLWLKIDATRPVLANLPS